MLDAFEILTTSGVVLWSKTYAPIGAGTINSLIKDVFIEDRASGRDYKKDKYTLKWTIAKDFGLIFVAVYQSLLQLTWVEELLENVKILFTDLYRDELQKLRTTSVKCPFDNYFDLQVQALETTISAPNHAHGDAITASDLTPPSSSDGDGGRGENFAPPLPTHRKAVPQIVTESDTSTDITPVGTPDSSRPSSPALNHLLTAKVGPGKQSRRARKLAATSAPTSRDVSTSSKLKVPGKGTAKAKRTWGDDGVAGEEDDTVLDYSAATDGTETPRDASVPEAIARESFTTRTNRGEYILKDLDEEMSAILSKSQAEKSSTSAPTGIVSSSISSISSMFRSVVGGKSLTAADLAGPMKAMRDQLSKKNVAPPAAARLCEMVQAELIDTKTGSFQSIEAAVHVAMENALAKILSPTSNLDLLRAAQEAKDKGRPYVISMVGVNGVGKSTTLAKLAFLLLNNNYRVLVCAADTFRSGAVEQLRVHVRNLTELTSRGDGLGSIDLYERGYGGDAATLARGAVRHAAAPGPGIAPYDVVLVDTAGRRHNDNSLMASLAKFAQLAQPDKILMVGEALVGTDSVAQARRFNESFGAGRSLDGFVISKCDTVGDMVGTLVSMVDATGAPVVALGVGQHYGDLRALNVAWAVRLLMS